MTSTSTDGETRRDLLVGVVIYPETLPLDFIGPTCLLNALSPARLSSSTTPARASFTCIHLAEHAGPTPTACSFGLNILPQATFADVRAGRQRKPDIILIPGGTGARPWNASEELGGFVKWAAEECEWVLTVCTGSWLLASTGGLDGQRATTNKKAFLECKLIIVVARHGENHPAIAHVQDHTSSHPIEWIPKARWVRSGKFWTASGVSAGMDMASAFIDEVAGKEAGEHARGYAEYTASAEGDDPFAEKCGLV